MSRLVPHASAYELAVSLPYALAFAFVGVEVTWLAVRREASARVDLLRSAATATTMAAGALAVGLLYTWVLRGLWSAVATARWEGAAHFWSGHPLIAGAATFVAWDFVGWAYHLIGHRTRLGWAAHQPHHTGEEFNATLGLRQSWAPFHGLVLQPWLALAGFDLRVAFVCAAVSNSWQLLEHTSAPVRFPRWFSAQVMTPAAHRHHHAHGGGGVNLGPVFTWWDRLAGTWVAPETPAPARYGPAVPSSSNPLRIEAAGWVALIRRPAGPWRRDRSAGRSARATPARTG